MEGDLQRRAGHNLRAYRQAQGLSQEAFADVLGVHRTYMGGIERGERNLTLRSLERLVAADFGWRPASASTHWLCWHKEPAQATANPRRSYAWTHA